MMLAGAVCVLLVAHSASRQQHPVRALLASSVCGIASMAALALLAPYTGVLLPLNRFTGFVAAVLGMPGVVTLLLLNLIF